MKTKNDRGNGAGLKSGRWTTIWASVLTLGLIVSGARGYTYYEPQNHSVAANVTVQSTGVMTISQGATSFTVRSYFSRPNGGMLFLGPADSGTNNQTWAVTVTQLNSTQYRVTGSNSWYSLNRTITVFPRRIEVKDTFTNLTGQVKGVRFANEIMASDAVSALVAGVAPVDSGLGLNAPERSFVQAMKSNLSLGLVARDDVYRNQSVCYYTASGNYGIKDDNLGLPANGSYTTCWELYPTNSADPFDFYNAVRAEWGTANGTVPGLFAFIYPQWTWKKYNKKLDQMTVTDMKEWLDTNGVDTVCFIIQDDLENGDIEAFGSRYLVSNNSKAYWLPIIQKLRQAKPDIKVCPYFHLGCDIPDDPILSSCRMILNGGAQKLFTNYKGLTRWYYYPTPTNAFGLRMRQVFNATLSDFNSNAYYWDGYSYGHVSEYLQGADWDNCSVIIDNTTNAVTKQVTLTSMITKAVREAWTEELVNQGITVWTNWQPTTEHDTALNQPHFLEHFYNGQYAARGYLSSPIQLNADSGVYSNADVQAAVYRFLQYGLLYAHIGTGAYAEKTPSFLKYVYPITPAELHAGYVLGKERILTSVSGAFGFGDNRTMTAYIYDIQGRLKNDVGQTVTQNGKTYQLVNLNAGEIAVIGPEEPRIVLPVFADDFEEIAPGDAPDEFKWSTVFGGGSTIIATDVPAAQGSQSARIAGENYVANMGLDSHINSGPFTTFFISASVRIDSDEEAVNGAGLDFMFDSGISAALRFVPKGIGTGKYDVKVLWKTSGGTVKWDLVATNQPIGTWSNWVFGVQITNSSTGAGVYTLYQNGSKIADAVPFSPYSTGVTSITKLRCWGDLNYWHLDNVKVYDVAIVPQVSGTVYGQVALEGYTGSKVLTPVQVEFFQNGQKIKTMIAKLDTDGNFSLASGLSAGTYDVTFKAACWLKKLVPGVVVSTETASAPIYVWLRSGDGDGDNEVASTDLSTVLKDMDQAGN